MATNIPPHNLGEVLRGCIYLIENPDATVANLLDKVKGPDFPLGGKIVTDRTALRTIYEEGVGSIKVQGEWKLEKLDRGRQQIVVTSIPYGVNKGTLEAVIGQLIEEKKLPQLLGSANESNDKDGMRIVLELRPGTDPQPRDGVPLQAHRAAKVLLVQHDGARPGSGRQGPGPEGRAEPEGHSPPLPRLPDADRPPAVRVRTATAPPADSRPRRVPHH